MPRMDITEMTFAKVYPLLVAKAEKKGRTRDEVAQVTAWLTGYTPEELAFADSLAGTYSGSDRAPGVGSQYDLD